MSIQPYPAIVHCVERRVFPWKTWQKEYFTTLDLAKRTANFYREHIEEVPGGIDTNINTVELLVLKTKSGIRLNELGRDGAIYIVKDRFDLGEITANIQFLGEWVKDQIEEVKATQPQLSLQGGFVR